MQKGEIREKLDAFIRKYYLNQLIRGGLISATLLLALFLFLNLTEFYGHFSTTVRAMLFWSFLGTFAFVLIRWIVRPLLGLYQLGKVISYHEAAMIIGNHFGHVRDKLLNLLQLEEMAVGHPDAALLAAGIEQKTSELRPVSFAGAVNIGANQKYLRYLAIPLACLGVILVFQSNIIFDGSKRLIHYNTFYKQKAPFSFEIMNKSLVVERGSGFDLRMKINGKAVPEDAYLILQGQEIKMLRNDKNEFVYSFKNLSETESFHFQASGFESDRYQIEVDPKPAITAAEALITYPAYIGKAPELLPNTSDFTIPEGSDIEWKFQTRDADRLVLSHGSVNENFESSGKRGNFGFRKKFLSNIQYKVQLYLGSKKAQDTLSYHVSVVPDKAPSVFAEKKDDTSNIKQFYFLGTASDDYGVQRVTFNYRFVNSNNADKLRMGAKSVTLPVDGTAVDKSFYYVLNMDALGMAPADEVEYYFEAWDNDGIHGSKVTRTNPEKLKRQGLDEVRKSAEETSGKVKSLMSQAFKDAKELQKSSKDMQDRLNREKGVNWEDRSQVEELLNKQKKFEEKLDKLQSEQQKLKQQQEEFQSQKNEKIKEKQEQMEQLFKELKNDELKKLMDEIEKLLEKKASKEELNEKLQQLEQKNQEMNKSLDQLMEQYKQLQLEQKIQDNIDQLQQIAEKEQMLAEQTAKSGKEQKSELQKQQQELEKKLQEVQEEMKEAQKMNEELEKPMNLDEAKEEQQKAQEEMDNAEKNLEDGKNKKASENEKNAAEQMKKAAQKMKENLEAEEQKKLGEDYQKVRQLLENLVDASFRQEEVFSELVKIREYNPRYIELNRKQMSIKEDCAMIEDSLRALAKRQPMVSTFITKEISRINSNMQYALESLNTRHVGEAAMREQYVMTGLNNLAVMLMESMEKMQQQMSKNKKGNQSCNKPGGNGKGQGKGKPKAGDKLSNSQQQLGKMLQELQKKAQAQKQGQQNGKGEKGGQSETGNRELNKDFARIALMQEALRRQLDAMKQNLEKKGPAGTEASKELQKTEEMMEQQERDLVNKKITPEMLERQKQIETRMLEHERSDRNQQTEDDRQSNQPPAYTPMLPPELKAYLKEKQRERELLRQSPPELNPYYRDKSRDYLQNVR